MSMSKCTDFFSDLGRTEHSIALMEKLVLYRMDNQLDSNYLNPVSKERTAWQKRGVQLLTQTGLIPALVLCYLFETSIKFFIALACASSLPVQLLLSNKNLKESSTFYFLQGSKKAVCMTLQSTTMLAANFSSDDLRIYINKLPKSLLLKDAEN